MLITPQFQFPYLPATLVSPLWPPKPGRPISVTPLLQQCTQEINNSYWAGRYVGGVTGRGVITMTGERGEGPNIITGGLPFIRSEAKQHLGFKTGEQEVVFGCLLGGGG